MQQTKPLSPLLAELYVCYQMVIYSNHSDTKQILDSSNYSVTSVCQLVHGVSCSCMQTRQWLCKALLMPSNIHIIALTLGWCFLSIRFVIKPHLQCSFDAAQSTQVSHWLRQSRESQHEGGLIFGWVWTVSEGQSASRQKLGWAMWRLEPSVRLPAPPHGVLQQWPCANWQLPTVCFRLLGIFGHLVGACEDQMG